MADYAITGKKGSGKTLFAVGVIRDALKAGKRVATNLDVHLDALFTPGNKLHYIRIPDKPTIDDFEALGRGQPGVVEDDNGLLVLDETSTFFNSRSFGDKSRQPMLDWLVHSRKLGWDVYYICQGLGQIDKQLRETMIEYHVPVKRTDKWPIPIITPLTSALGYRVGFPKMHVGIFKHGCDRDSLTVERRWYRGRDLYSAYDTQQLFLDREHPKACGMHTKLPAYHLKGRYLSRWEMSKPVLVAGLMMGAVVGALVGGVGVHRYEKITEASSTVQPVDTSRKVLGVMRDGNLHLVFFDGGQQGKADKVRMGTTGEEYLVDGKWVLVK